MTGNQRFSPPPTGLEYGMDVGHWREAGQEARVSIPRITWPTWHPKSVPAAWGRLIDTRRGLEA